MKKYTLILLILAFYNVLNAQSIDRLKFATRLSLSNASFTEYSHVYEDLERYGGMRYIYEDFGPVNNFEIRQEVDYKFFKKLSIGAHTGFTQFGKPKVLAWRLGGGFKYWFMTSKNHYLGLEMANYSPISKKNYGKGYQARLTLNFDIYTIEDKTIELGVYLFADTFDMDHSRPVYENEIPGKLEYGGLGFNLGIGF